MKIGFPAALALLFIGLKLTAVIGWSWFWVLSPIWFSFLIGVAVVVGSLVILAVNDK